MRLVTVGVEGYKRFAARQEMHVDGRVIAIVGPNEAGKTSWLRALVHLTSRGELARGEWTRGQPRPGERVIWARYALDGGDREALHGLHGAEKVRWYEAWKGVDGGLYHGYLPRGVVTRDVAPRHRSVQLVRQAAAHRLLRDPENADEPSRLAAALSALADALDAGENTLGDEVITQISAVASQLDATDVSKGLKYLRELSERLRQLSEHESAPDPHQEALDRLYQRQPRMLWFGEEERDLRSSYELTEDVDAPPKALASLAQLAGLDLRRLRDQTVAEEFGEAERMVEDANARLRDRFADAWRQSGVYVRLRTDETVLRILIRATGGGYTDIAERSDGLRAFIALLTFTALHAHRRPAVLVLDEADNHLHYDAQADLVRVFSRQTTVAKVIYTTHSAGCLPQDLSGVRMIVPANGESQVRNWFWSEGPGFSPLLIGMGASVLAFTPARYAVFVEGGSEVVLLPTLLREAVANDDDDLGYQVVPSLAEISVAQVVGLDVEAARVACLVDGDAGGRKIRKKLLDGGMDDSRVVVLGGASSGLVLEDLLVPDVYLQAVNAELARSHGEATRMPMSALPNRDRPRGVKAWCAQAGVSEPNKRAVGYRLLDMRAERGAALTASTQRKVLRQAHRQLLAALRLPASEPAVGSPADP